MRWTMAIGTALAAALAMPALAAGVLNTWRRFAVPAATPVLLNLAMIAAAWWGVPWFKALGVTPIYALSDDNYLDPGKDTDPVQISRLGESKSSIVGGAAVLKNVL